MMIEHLLDKSLSPFDVCIVPIGGNKNPAVDVEAVRIQNRLEDRGLEVLLDDRNLGPGPRFTDMDLIGIDSDCRQCKDP